MTRWILVWVLLFGGLVACDQGLPKVYRVDRLRVLGIQAEPPEVAPGDTVTLSALVVDFEERAISFAWSACVLPERGSGPFGGGAETGASGGVGYGIDDGGSCLEIKTVDPGLVIDLGNQEQALLTIPGDLLSDWSNIATAYGLPPDKPLPAEARQGLTDIAGVNMIITLEVRAGDDVLVALKRVNVSTAGEKNANPIDAVFHMTTVDDTQDAPVKAETPADGSCLTTEHGGLLSVVPGKHLITALNVPTDLVEYPVLSIGTTVDLVDILTTQETVYYSVFSTVGKFSKRVFKSGGTRRVRWSVKEDDVGDARLWVVTRDGRGGTTWCEQSILIEAPTP